LTAGLFPLAFGQPAMTAIGQGRRFRDVRDESGLPPAPDLLRHRGEPTLRVDAVEKGFWAGAASNIDSKRASRAQDRSKKSATMILLSRADGTPQTF
jgi:hypothetical protein